MIFRKIYNAIARNHKFCKAAFYGDVDKATKILEGASENAIRKAIEKENHWAFRTVCARGKHDFLQFLIELYGKNDLDIFEALQKYNYRAWKLAIKNMHKEVSGILISHAIILSEKHRECANIPEKMLRSVDLKTKKKLFGMNDNLKIIEQACEKFNVDNIKRLQKLSEDRINFTLLAGFLSSKIPLELVLPILAQAMFIGEKKNPSLSKLFANGELKKSGDSSTPSTYLQINRELNSREKVVAFLEEAKDRASGSNSNQRG